jgi:hypothetical protein
MPYTPRGWEWLSGEIEGLPQTPGFSGPPERGEGVGAPDYLRSLIDYYTTPRRRQQTSYFEGGMHFGPGREASVSPGDMGTAEDLMTLLASITAEQDLEERRALEMAIRGRPTGGGTIEWKGGKRPTKPSPTEFDKARRPPSALSGLPQTRHIMAEGDRPLTRLEAINLGAVEPQTGAPPQTGAQEEIARAMAEAQGAWYGARAAAATRPEPVEQLNAAQMEALQDAHQEVLEIRRRLNSPSITEMEKREQLEKLALLEDMLRRHGFDPSQVGAPGRGPGGGGVVMPRDGEVIDWTP